MSFTARRTSNPLFNSIVEPWSNAAGTQLRNAKRQREGSV